MLNYLKEILYLLNDDRKKIPWMVVIFLLASFVDLIGLSLIGPYIALIINPDFLPNKELQFFLKFTGAETTNSFILILGIGLVIIFLIKAIAGILINKSILRFAFNRSMNLQVDLMRSYQNLPYTNYLDRNSSGYLHVLQKLTDLYQSVIQSMLKLISESIVGLAVLVFLFMVSGPALGILAVVLAAAIFAYDIFFKNKINQSGILVNKYSIQIVKGIQEAMSGFKEIRVLHREEYFYSKVKSGAFGYSKAMEEFHFISAIPRYLIELMLVVFLVLMVVSALIIDNNLEALIPVLAVFGMAALRLLPSANMLIDGIAKLRYARNSISILYKDYRSFVKNQRKVGKNNAFHNNNIVKFNSLVVQNINYIYPGTIKRSLKDVSFQVKSGESIGLIGASGSGKTTLVDVLLGLLPPVSGEIIFNGDCMQNNLIEWRSNIAYLPQQVFLTDTSLKTNVALGIEHDSIDMDRLNISLKQARLSDLVSDLPNGVETIIGENGVKLSGGQRQRIALARAFYHERNILIMDESTSALDNETEEEVIDEIKRLKGVKTLIIIAHRLTTLQHCDRIYRLEKGRIVECSTYQDIINNDFKASVR